MCPFDTIPYQPHFFQQLNLLTMDVEHGLVGYSIKGTHFLPLGLPQCLACKMGEAIVLGCGTLEVLKPNPSLTARTYLKIIHQLHLNIIC